MSQTTTPSWMTNIYSDSFEAEIGNKIGSKPHYPGPVLNIGGLRVGSQCRIPGIQPFEQTILRPNTCVPQRLTDHCFNYGVTTRFPPRCNFCTINGWSNSSCCSCYCNPNSNVIPY